MSHAVNEQDRALRELAEELVGRGWRVPALLTLIAGRPLSFLLGQFLWIAQPAASLVWPRPKIAMVARLLEDEEAVRRLQEYLSGAESNE
jgi:hypothetical protein